MKPLFALAIVLFPAAVWCQQLPSLGVLLGRLDAYAKQYQATLPSLVCDEQITSQAINIKGKVAWEMKIQSSLREVRTVDPYNPFREEREYKRVNGRRARHVFQTPYFVEGGFAGLVGFKSWEQTECFDYVLTSGENAETVRLSMRLKTTFTNSSCAKLPAGLYRIVVADPETGRILHTERTIAPEAAEKAPEVYFGEIDYAPQKLGEQTFWLPSRFYSHDSENTGRMVATYSTCHRYTVESKILPGMSFPAASPKSR